MRSKIERGIKFEHHTKSANVHIKFFNLLFPSFIGPVTSSYLTLLYKKYMLKSLKFLSGMLFFVKVSTYKVTELRMSETNERFLNWTRFLKWMRTYIVALATLILARTIKSAKSFVKNSPDKLLTTAATLRPTCTSAAFGLRCKVHVII